MSRNTGNKSTTTRNNGSPLLTGILIGMVIGVGLAAGLAWYVMKSPSPFVTQEHAPVKLPVDVPKAASPAVTSGLPVAASGISEGKPRFEFYKVLTDKQETTAASAKPTEKQPKPAEKQTPVKSQPAEEKAVAAHGPYFLQAASYSNVDDADKLKAKLAMLGIEAYIQTTTIPDKGVWHRVRMGPYTNSEELNRARNLLKQNGVEATQVHAQ